MTIGLLLKVLVTLLLHFIELHSFGVASERLKIDWKNVQTITFNIRENNRHCIFDLEVLNLLIL